MNLSKVTQAGRLRNLAQSRPSTRVCYGKNASLQSQLIEAFASLWRTPPKATALICALALLLPAIFAIFSSSFKSVEENLLLTRQVTVFLDSQLTKNDANLLANNLSSNQKIQSSVVTPVNIQNHEVLTIVLQPSTKLAPTDIEHIVQELNSHSSVDFVDVDINWLDENLQAIKTTKTLGILSAALTALVTSILAYAITCTDLMRHRTDYRILNQLGASQSTVMKPFILRSLLLTTVAVSASILIVWGLIAISAHYRVDVSTYNGLLPASMPIAALISLGMAASISTVIAVLLKSRKLFNSHISTI